MQSTHTRAFHAFSVAATILISGVVLIFMLRQAMEAVPQRPQDQIFDSWASRMGSKEQFIPVTAPLGTIHAIVASTTEAQRIGLSGRFGMASSTGMIFVYDRPQVQGFWMKDMFFPIDIIWIDTDKTVLGIEKDASPLSYPKVFFSPAPAQYVLELHSGGAAAMGIATGTQLVF